MLYKRLVAVVVLSLQAMVLSPPSLSDRPAPEHTLSQQAQPRLTALFEFAISVRYELMVAVDTPVTGSAPPLEGLYTIEDALARLLEGSGLTYQIVDEKIRIIRSR